MNTSEKELESIICRQMTGEDGLANLPDTPAQTPNPDGIGYFIGNPRDFDREFAVDTAQLFAFFRVSQPEEWDKLGISAPDDPQNYERRKFLKRLSEELKKRGVVALLRDGIQHEQARLTLFCAPPSEGNPDAAALYAKNRFSLTRQLAYSQAQNRRTLDLCIFINGLPLLTFELKNRLTKQNAEDAARQYRRDRRPDESLFFPGRCAAHFALDDSEVKMCAELKGEDSIFLPFNKGYKDGAGNPPNPAGIKTDYLWREILKPDSLSDIVCNYAQMVETPAAAGQRRKQTPIWPRYHQLDAVRKLLADARCRGAGRRYLVQHSPGSGKSNTIAWLAHQLIGIRKRRGNPEFDSVIVATDRLVLDGQLRKNILQFEQVDAIVGHADDSGQLRNFIKSGKRIIITTVQKFPKIMDALQNFRGKRFAVVIDEAHSGQGGRTTAAMNVALGDGDCIDPEDIVNAEMEKQLETRAKSRKLLQNVSYFAFTATPKNKTLEMFGEKADNDADGKTPFRSFHLYAMKQAIQEEFILDVLAHYTPVNVYCRLAQQAKDDRLFDVKKANKKLLRYAKQHRNVVDDNAGMIAEHFHHNVYSAKKIGGQARAMVVCGGIRQALAYHRAISQYLHKNKRPYNALVAFSGEHEYDGVQLTEAGVNKFPMNQTAAKFRESPYRILICADKFQTGYDEPLLHTMYVLKVLSGIKAVQTLSRLNRAHPQKTDCFVLDFENNADGIAEAFQDYYRETILSGKTDPNKLHDLKTALDDAGVYSQEGHVNRAVQMVLGNEPREHLDPVLDECVSLYDKLSDDRKIQFKGDIYAFCRTYNFLGAVLPYTNREWEKLSVFLHLLARKLPAISDEDLAHGILELVNVDAYVAEKKQTMKIPQEDKDSVIDPFSSEKGGARPEPMMDWLPNIIKDFNERFGHLFGDKEGVFNRMQNNIVPKVLHNKDYQNARKHTRSTLQEVREDALDTVMSDTFNDDVEFSKQYMENPDFRAFILDLVEKTAEHAEAKSGIR